MSFLWPDCLHNTVGVAAILLLLLHTAAVFADDGREQALQAQLQTLLAKPATADTAPAQATAIQNFYAAREHRPAWVNSRRLMQLRQLGQLARNHGLDPADYHLTELAQRIEQLFDTDGVEALAALELMATYSIARLASHLHVGKVDPVGRYAVAPGAAAAPPLITRLLTSAADAESLFAYLDSLPPDTLLYRKLQWSLAWHRALLEQGTAWALIPRGRTLETGMTDARVPLLRQRLGLAAREIDADVYDAELTQAVADFQARHLLDSDGLLGRRTLAALNTSIQARVDQLRVNLEWQRWAAMPEHDEYLLVNVAHYTMHWMQDGARVWSTRTMVGRSRRPTPTFKSAFSAIMINPAWTVPPTIFREDLLPQLQADAGHLQRQRMRVIDRSGHAVDSAMIDWQQTSAADFPYRLRASPGGSNPLGRMKFLTPNPYLVYLHDTPAKHLFENATRAFSSGCIRVEQPEILAKLLTDRQPGNVRERLQAALAGQRSRFIGLEQPIPIVVMYGTVDLNAADELVFARDLYGKDLRVLTALNSIDEQQRTTVLANLAPLITL
jgi:murein L,D-transpeptidase YcbB/YkuD